MLRSRIGVAGRSAVWTGVSSTGRSSAGRAARSPAPIDPLLQVRALLADGGVEAVAGQHVGAARQREELLVDRPDDGREVAAFEGGGAGSAREQGVAAEE